MKHINLSTLHSRTVPGNESIAFQDGSFMRDTTEAVNQFRNGYLNKAGFCNLFAKITEKHTNIWVTLSIEDELYNAYIYPSWLCSANALAHPNYRKYEQFTRMGFRANEKPLTAYINDKTSKVGGFLTEIENKMVICSSYLENKEYSDAGVASVLIHEVGHAYTFFQYSIRVVVFNAALNQASQNLSKARNYEEVKIIFNETCDVLDISEREFIKETKNTDNRVTQYTYLASNMGKVFDVLPNFDVSDKFTQDAAEELADIFVARHGGAKARMEMRAHYEKYSGSKTIVKSTMVHFAKIASMIGLVVVAPASSVVSITGCILGIGSIVKLYGFIKTHTSISGYTTAFQQIKKMQNQLIEQIKESKIKDKSLINSIEEAMSYGDQLLATVSNNDSAFYTVMSFFNTSMRDARGMRFYQDQLEGLTSNRLFLSASKFTT